MKQLEVEDNLEETGNVKLIAKTPSGLGAQAFPLAHARPKLSSYYPLTLSPPACLAPPPFFSVKDKGTFTYKGGWPEEQGGAWERTIWATAQTQGKPTPWRDPGPAATKRERGTHFSYEEWVTLSSSTKDLGRYKITRYIRYIRWVGVDRGGGKHRHSQREASLISRLLLGTKYFSGHQVRSTLSKEQATLNLFSMA